MHSKAYITSKAEPTRHPPKQNPASFTPLAQALSDESTRFQTLFMALQVENSQLRVEYNQFQAIKTVVEQKCVEKTTQVEKLEDEHSIYLQNTKSYRSCC